MLVALPLSTAASAAEELCPPAPGAFDPNGDVWQAPKATAKAALDILAIGSSSTEGIGASSPDKTYPARLEAELDAGGAARADVRNAGVGGEVASATLPRLLAALRTGWPQLVIWQVGTNDAIVGVDERAFRATVQKGVAAARAAGVPIWLMGPQYTPHPADNARYERYVDLVDRIGDDLHVPVYSRFAMMMKAGVKTAVAFLSGDGLHMNDRGYRCVAHALALAIEGAPAGKL